MLIPFAIEPEAYKAAEQHDLGEKKILIRSLLDFWRDHGVLLLPGGNEWDEWVSKLDPIQGGRLKDAYKDDRKFRRKNTGEIRWDSLKSDADIVECGDSLNIGMVILEPTRASVLGLPDGDHCKHCGQVEITLWHYASHTCSIDGLRDLAQKRIQPEDTPQAIWDSRLRNYAEYSRQVVIADPYAAHNLSQTREPSNGLPFLLNRLMGGDRKNGKSLNITVFSTYDDRDSASPHDSFANIKSKIEGFFNGQMAHSGVKKIDFYLLSYVSHHRKFHDRWVRFDNNVITLGKGLAVLDPVHYNHRQNSLSIDFGLISKEDSVSDIMHDENELKRACKGFEHFTISM